MIWKTEGITVSNSGQRIYIDMDKLYFEHEDERIEAFVKTHTSAINMPLHFIEDKPYLSAQTLARLFGYQVKTFDETGSVVFYSEDAPLYETVLSQGTDRYLMIENRNRIKWDSTTQSVKMYVYQKGEGDSYTRVMNESGDVFDIKTGQLSSLMPLSTEIQPYRVETQKVAQPVSLTWEAVESYNQSLNKQDTQFESELNVISPTWFNLNVNGILINSAEIEYVNNAHNQGLAVWGLYKNNFDPDWTQDLLGNTIDQDYSIAQLLYYANFYHLDGINLDFENIYLKDQDALSDYVANMSKILKMNDLTLSMDVTRPRGSDQWSKVYDRAALQSSVDYMVLMAYDEFWASSPLSGPVASIPWTEQSIEWSLETIPAHKLVLGMPYYTRRWEESKQGNSWKKTGSKAITISATENLIEEKSLDISYDEDNGVNYTEYTEEGIRYRIWIEDVLSLEKRLGLANQHRLAGVASWRRGYGNDAFEKSVTEWLNQ